MVNDAIELLLRLNGILAAAILAVLILRGPVRRAFGARVAYGLWLVAPFAAAMCFVPGRLVHVVLDAPLNAGVPAMPSDQSWLLWAWAAGALVSLLILAQRQARFTRALGRLHPRLDLGARVLRADSASHGPAVLGVLNPIIVTPADFDQRVDEEERRIVLAHERAHLAQGDPWINAAVLAVQCLAWFNPFAHLGARALRIDQELACDAAVLAQGEGVRRRYAEAMLKTHLAAAAPLGCAWPASDLTAFKERIAMLKRTLPSRTQRLIGVSAVALATAGAAAAAWAAQPARVVTTVAPAEVQASAPPAARSTALIEAHDDALRGGEDAPRTRRLIIADGDDLTPEEEAAIRAELDRAREQVERARIEVREAVRDVRIQEMSAEERTRIRTELDRARDEVRRARIIERNAVRDVRVRRLTDAEEAQIREALRGAERALAESQVERERALAAAREALRDAEVDIAAARAVERRMPEVRAEIRAARAEVAREAARARASGDLRRAEDLERAERALEGAADER